MILLIWEQGCQEELEIYEFEEDSREAELAKACDGKLVGAQNDDETDQKLEELSEILRIAKSRLRNPGPFGPYSAIYISGFIP